MESEISIEGEMLESALIDELKAIDAWILLTTFFILNLDQHFPFHLNIKETTPTETVDPAYTCQK